MKPYYEEDGITIYHGDCREVLPVLGVIDAVVTDPPYGVSFGGKSTKHAKRSGEGYLSFDDSPEYVSAVIIPTIVQLIERFGRVVVTPGIRCCFMYPNPTAMGAIFYPSGAGLGRWGFTCSQPVLYYGSDPYLSAGMGHRPDSISTTDSAGENGHPCPKPLSVMKWLVKKATLDGETVLDPFMGSGTTLRAAKDLGRKAIGIEIEEKYCEIASSRLSQRVLELSA